MMRRFLATILATLTVSAGVIAATSTPVGAVVNPPGFRLADQMTFYAYVAPGETLDASFIWSENFQNRTVTFRVTDPLGAVRSADGNPTPGQGCVVPGSQSTTIACTWTNLAGTDPAGIWKIDASTGNGMTFDFFTWDIAVRNGADAEIPGRVYTEELRTYQTAGANDITLWYQSSVGYQYSAFFDNYAGAGSAFRSDATGVAFDGTCTSAYLSIPAASTAYEQRPLNACGPAYKIFFQPPDPGLPESATLPGGATTFLLPAVPSAPTIPSVTFTPNSPTVRSGLIDFTVDDFVGQIDVQVDADGDGIYGESIDRSFPTAVTTGSASIAFDGLDGDGLPIPLTRSINIRVAISRVGEIHFTAFDVETRTGGLEVTATRGGSGELPLYWNDSLFNANPCGDGTAGVPSGGGAHRWGPGVAGCSGNYGDQRYVDEWVYSPVNVSNTLALPGFVPAPALSLDKEADRLVAEVGDVVTYTFTVTNDGNVPVTDVVINDPLDGLSVPVCDDTSLDPGDVAVCTATYTVGDQLSEIVNTATASGVADGDVVPTASAAASVTVEVPEVVGVPMGSTPVLAGLALLGLVGGLFTLRRRHVA